VPFTLLRNGLYTERYTDHLREYLEDGEIMGAAGNGGISAASRQDYAAAAAAAILQDERGDRTYELGGPAFGLPQLARVICEVTGAKVTYRDLPAKEYAHELHGAGLDEATARFVAAVDASIARGELETSSADLTSLLGGGCYGSRRGRARGTRRLARSAASWRSQQERRWLRSQRPMPPGRCPKT